jgi:hypothetical protein
LKIAYAERQGNFGVERRGGVLRAFSNPSPSETLATAAYDQPVTFRLYGGSTTPERSHWVWFDNLVYEPYDLAE